jgi:hypothetical protein
MPQALAVIGIIGLIAGADQAHNQQIASRRARRAGEREVNERNRIQDASEGQRLQESKRQQLREQRVRKAKILQAAENRGVGGSSGEANSISNLSTNVNSNLAFQEGQGGLAEAVGNVDFGSTAFQAEAGAAGARSGLATAVGSTALTFAGPEPFKKGP